MLDITLLRKDVNSVVTRLQTRKNPQPFLDVAAFQALEAERKTLQTRTEELQARRNSLSKQIGQLKARRESVDGVMQQVEGLKGELDVSAARLDLLQLQMQSLLLAVPNLPHESVPVGKSADDNVVVRTHGTPPVLDFTPKPHWDLGTALGILALGTRQRLRLFVWRDPFDRYVACLVYVPREAYSTDLRLKFQKILLEAFHGIGADFDVLLSGTTLARIHFTVRTTSSRNQIT